MDTLSFLVVRSLFYLINLLPHNARIELIVYVIRLVIFFMPKHARVADTNLLLAFPHKDAAWRKQIINESFRSFARLIVDFARLPQLDRAWIKEHVTITWIERFKAVKKARPNTGIIIATGHLGSFELMGHAMPHNDCPISFVVRDFKSARIDQWWRSQREAVGNRVISRKGAVKETVAHLREGRDVAILFDQNVRDKFAIFVPWFSKLAATTKALALAAVKTKASVFLVSISYLGDDKYKMIGDECDFAEIYQDKALNLDEKIYKITAELTARYEHMILNNPGEWFWMHRRWKTRPAWEKEPPFYT